MSQPAVNFERAPWQVRIRRQPDALPRGGGMLCRDPVSGDDYVVTCAHVVGDKGAPPGGPVYVEFQHVPDHEPIRATVAPDGWIAQSKGDRGRHGDIAVLRLDGPIPVGAAPAPLCPSPDGAVNPHGFHTYGYPQGHPEFGVPTRGTIIGHAEAEWLSLQTKPGSQELEPGFSGSPVWDTKLRGVVGIVVSRDDPRSSGDLVARTAPYAGYAIRIEVLAEYWPPLRPAIVAREPAAGSEPAPGSEPVTGSEPLDALLELPLLPDGTLPTVGDRSISVYKLGVTQSKYVSVQNPDPPYVPRARLDADIRSLLDAGERFILAVGDSKSGKSRSMAQALRECRPQARFIVPVDDPAALQKLAGRPLPVGDDESVLWLDDIDRYVVPQGFDHSLLNRLLDREPPVIVVGTITSKRYNDITSTRDVGTRLGQVLTRARVVRVHSTLNQEDRAEAERLYPQEDFSQRGIGEQLIAAARVEDRYLVAREGCPEGWAVVQAAVDWGRIGVPGPVSRVTLRSLFPRYLAEAAPDRDASDELFAQGVEWARELIVGTIALIAAAGPPGEQAAYRAFGYLLAFVDGQAIAIAPCAWDEAIARAGGEELLAVTYEAMVRGEHEIAGRAAEAAHGRSADLATRAFAALLLGGLYQDVGEWDTAIAFLEEAADSDVPDVAPFAQVDLGSLLVQQGRNPDRGRDLLQLSVAAEDPHVRAQAQLNLGVLLLNSGNLNDARPLLEEAMAAPTEVVVGLAEDHFFGLGTQAIEQAGMARQATVDVGGYAKAEGDGPAAGDWSRKLRASTLQVRAESVHVLAMATLGGLLVTEGDLDRARELLDAALNSGNPAGVPLARLNLGILLARNSDLRLAREQFEQVLESSDPMTEALAKMSLGYLLAVNGEWDRGVGLLSEVAASDNADQAPRALCELGEMYLDRGDLEVARSYLERAAKSGHRDWGPSASVTLGMLAAREGDLDRARQRLLGIRSAGHPVQSPRAAGVLGDILLNAGDLDGAEESYRSIINQGNPFWSRLATMDLATARARQGAQEEAATLLQSVANGGDRNAAPQAACLLGDLLRSGDQADGARAAYLQAIEFGHPEWSVVARFSLAQLLVAEQDQTEAEGQLRQIIDHSPSRAQVAKAWDWLGELLGGSGSLTEAEQAYRQAIAADVRDWSALARVHLAVQLLDNNEDIEQSEPLLDEAVASGVAEVEQMAHLVLGFIALHVEQRDRARAEFRQAESGPPQVAAPATFQLAKIAQDDGDLDEAAALLDRLIEGPTGDDALRRYAAAHLGALRLRQHDPEEAMRLLRWAAASDDPDTAAYCLDVGTQLFEGGDLDAAAEILTAALTAESPLTDAVRARLGMVRLAEGSVAPGPLAESRYEEARALLATALDGASPGQEPEVRRYLGTVLARLGRRADARQVLAPLVDSADTEHRPFALLLLGRMAAHEDDDPTARRWLTEAVETAHPEVESEARQELAELRWRAGDIGAAREILALPGQDLRGAGRRRGQTVRGELEPAEETSPAEETALAKATTPAPAPASAPVSASGSAPAPAPAPSPRPALPPLPRAVLAALADLAELEGDLPEAGFWRGQA